MAAIVAIKLGVVSLSKGCAKKSAPVSESTPRVKSAKMKLIGYETHLITNLADLKSFYVYTRILS